MSAINQIHLKVIISCLFTNISIKSRLFSNSFHVDLIFADIFGAKFFKRYKTPCNSTPKHLKKVLFFFCETNFFFANKSFLVTFFQPIGLYNGKYEWASRPGSGDCSLNIMAVDIKFDDGLWECQVTASSFESQDALASKPARLVVRGTNEFQSIFSSLGTKHSVKI